MQNSGSQYQLGKYPPISRDPYPKIYVYFPKVRDTGSVSAPVTPTKKPSIARGRKVMTPKTTSRQAKTTPTTPNELTSRPATSTPRKRARPGEIEPSGSAKKRNIKGFYRSGREIDNKDEGKHWSILGPNLLRFPDREYTLYEKVKRSNPRYDGAIDDQSVQSYIDSLTVEKRNHHEAVVRIIEEERTTFVTRAYGLSLRRVKTLQKRERKEEERREKAIANGEDVIFTDDEESEKMIRPRPEKLRKMTTSEGSPKSK